MKKIRRKIYSDIEVAKTDKSIVQGVTYKKLNLCYDQQNGHMLNSFCKLFLALSLYDGIV